MTCSTQETLSLYYLHVYCKKYIFTCTFGGSSTFRTGGGGVPDAVKFYGSWDCFDVPSHYLPKVFIVRAYNKKHIVNVAC